MRQSIGVLLLAVIALGVFDVLRSDREGADSSREEAPATADQRGSGSEGEASVEEVETVAGRAPRTHEDVADAVVEGVVVYKATPRHRWRQARYYVRNPEEGLLAEAVVSLRGANLSGSLRHRGPQTRTMDQKDFQFTPETLAICVRDSVRFTNSDREVHNVRTLDGGRPFNISLAGGREYVHEFRRAGGIEKPVRLGCAFHGTMRAWIYVFDHPFFQVTGGDGRFRFEGVPPGEYWLDMVHAAGGLDWSRRIEIESGETLKVDIGVPSGDGIAVKEP